MITSLGLQNFKNVGEHRRLELGQLNVLCGANGRGKSTFSQGLLLLRQSVDYSFSGRHVVLNGALAKVGTFAELRNYTVSRELPVILEFGIATPFGSILLELTLISGDPLGLHAVVERSKVTFPNDRPALNLGWNSSENTFADSDDNMCRTLGFIPQISIKKEDVVADLDELFDFRRVHYVSADRLGPQDFYAFSSVGEFPSAGPKGEHFASIMSQFSDNAVDERLIIAPDSPSVVPDQLEGWLSFIFDGAAVKIESSNSTLAYVSLASRSSSRTFRPANEGFGLSYILPIILTCLIAAPGDVVIIENPEAHLHPGAQSRLTKFIALASSTGIQVVIETHSDHVFNAVRLSVHDKILSDRDVKLYYFSNELSDGVEEVGLNAKGALLSWPNGFFDQASLDYMRLMGG